MDRFNVIFSKSFLSSQDAVDYCQHLSHACGFSVRIRTSKSNTIYIVCSREGRPELKSELSKKRNRISERCNCKWKVVLYHNPHIKGDAKWEFRSGKTMEHNHSVFDDDDLFSLPPARTPYQRPTYRLPPLNSLDFVSSSPAPSSSPSRHEPQRSLPPLSQALASVMNDTLPPPRLLAAQPSFAFLLN